MSYHGGMNKGYYIWLDATCVAGPFETESDAWESLSPERRKSWTWELEGGMEAFLAIPLEAFSVEWGNPEWLLDA